MIDGEYVLQSDGQQPYWMPEIGLAITYGTAELNGSEQRLYGRSQREWLFWYDRDNLRYPTPTERAEAAIAAQTAAEQENIALRQRLRDLGIDPDA